MPDYRFWRRKQSETTTTTKKKKPKWREWVDAALFAVVAATLIRTFFIEAYTIPSESMEGSLLVNDYLFVSKLSYGPRLPMTPLAVPLVHNTMPLVGGNSYSEAVRWKYKRLPGFGDVKRYDVVVFNFPSNDTVIAEFPDRDYYQFVRSEGWAQVHSNYTIITRPVDKKENYIKRCVGVPGDKIELRQKNLFVNDKPEKNLPHVKELYEFTATTPLSEDFIQENEIEVRAQNGRQYILNIPNDGVAALQNIPGSSLRPMAYPAGYQSEEPGEWTYPYDTANFKWNRDNYGPIIVPAKGATVNLTEENIALYKRIIVNYEGNTLEEKNGQFLINGRPQYTYTFKMDYFWMMGDNRDNSLDSRYFGFVPEDHIVGKAWFVWLSYGKGGIRWKRLFRSIHSLEQ